MKPFMEKVTELFRKGYFDEIATTPSGTWNNTWSAMFYCGTVFTTIGEYLINLFLYLMLLMLFVKFTNSQSTVSLIRCHF